MTSKIVSQLDAEGYFIGEAVAYKSPLERDVFHIPAGAINVAAPTIESGKRAKWVDSAWVFEDLPVEVEEVDPVVEAVVVDPLDKLKSFLLANPDVATLLVAQ